jgi:putative Mg2+ transporter-C (MgtC) family protein
MWAEVADVMAAEFSDVPSLGDVVRILMRLGLAALLGGVLGWERERAGKAAGVRTHMLIALSSTMFILVSQQAGATVDDLTRVTQGVIAGIGFLGAGAIIKGGAEDNVKGLTTAAGIWFTAAIGIACGFGRESTAVLSTLLALVVLALVRHPESIRDK